MPANPFASLICECNTGSRGKYIHYMYKLVFFEQKKNFRHHLLLKFEAPALQIKHDLVQNSTKPCYSRR